MPYINSLGFSICFSCVSVFGLCLGYSGLTNGSCHAEDHNGASSPPSHTNNLLSGPMGRSGPIQSPPRSTGGVLQYADGPPRILPEEGQDYQGGESDTVQQYHQLQRSFLLFFLFFILMLCFVSRYWRQHNRGITLAPPKPNQAGISQ